MGAKKKEGGPVLINRVFNQRGSVFRMSDAKGKFSCCLLMRPVLQDKKSKFAKIRRDQQ